MNKNSICEMSSLLPYRGKTKNVYCRHVTI